MMNRRRLEKLRDTLRSLRPCTHVRKPGSRNGYTGTLEPTNSDTLCARAAGLPRIDTLDMRVEHGPHTDANGESRVLGCISGLAILMFPDDAAEAARTLPHAIVVCDASDVAQHVLGLEDEVADTLFNDHPDDPVTRSEPVTPEQAAQAVEHVLAGTSAMRIWDHATEKSPGSDNARDFLDRRDEARISHRLGRPFRF
ncbi:MAG: hypothetical protein OXQ28_07130 [Acidobacteriota bacterium]|nr:hypothetical protein [Acidobacteriota bacterium]